MAFLSSITSIPGSIRRTLREVKTRIEQPILVGPLRSSSSSLATRRTIQGLARSWAKRIPPWLITGAQRRLTTGTRPTEQGERQTLMASIGTPTLAMATNESPLFGVPALDTLMLDISTTTARMIALGGIASTTRFRTCLELEGASLVAP